MSANLPLSVLMNQVVTVKGVWIGLGLHRRLIAHSFFGLPAGQGKFLKGNSDYIFNFLENPDIPSTNNASERGIRKLKIKQKISGTFRSDKGAEAFMAVHSIADTAWKNKKSPFEAILALY